MVDYYAVMQVHPLAEQEVIEKAYKALVMKYHPDNGGDNERMVAINLAYEVLADPAKRVQYDRELLASHYGSVPVPPAVSQATVAPAGPAERDLDDASQWLGGAAATAKTGFRIADALLERAATGLGHLVEGGVAAAQDVNSPVGDSQADWNKAYARIDRLAMTWPYPVSRAAREEAASLMQRHAKVISTLSFPRGADGQRDLAWLAVRHPDPHVRGRVKARYEAKQNAPLVGLCNKCRRIVALDAEARCSAGHELSEIRYAGTRGLVEQYARGTTT